MHGTSSYLPAFGNVRTFTHRKQKHAEVMSKKLVGVDVEAEEVRRKAKMAEHARELSTEVIT